MQIEHAQGECVLYRACRAHQGWGVPRDAIGTRAMLHTVVGEPGETKMVDQISPSTSVRFRHGRQVLSPPLEAIMNLRGVSIAGTGRATTRKACSLPEVCRDQNAAHSRDRFHPQCWVPGFRRETLAPRGRSFSSDTRCTPDRCSGSPGRPWERPAQGESGYIQPTRCCIAQCTSRPGHTHTC